MKTKYSIGVDIGGTNTDIGLVRDDGKIIDKVNLHTHDYYDAEFYVSDMAAKIKEMLDRNNVSDIDGIGIGAPNGNTYKGGIDNAPNLNFKGQVKLVELMKKHINTKVVVSNDANAAAYGEMIYGGAKNLDHFITFTLGTGVGSGIIIDRKLVLGSTSTAGELGHSIIIINGRQCGCGRKGCLETYTSAGGIRRTALELMEQNPLYNGVLKQVAPENLTSKMVGDAANAGDPIGIMTFENVGYLLGIAMANAVTFSAPQAIFLMGGPVHAGEVLMKPLRKSFDEHLLNIYQGTVQIRVSELKDNEVAILGAAALCQL
ncbi:MAG: ROK family protein [Bacteroidales bacterium]|nr:ROK family protein [Bacteroidales bacterium]